MKLFSQALFPLTILVLTIYSCQSGEEKAVSNVKKPNIIFIMADDLGYGDVGIYGQTMIHTPHIDQLAHEGLLFTQMYAGSTVCAPSRSSLMTGLHTGHTTIRGNARASLNPADTTIGELLKRAGYTTGIIGKWGLGEAGSTGIPNKKGFDYFYGYLNQQHAHNYYPAYVWENQQRDSLNNKVELHNQGPGGYAVEKHTYIQDKFIEKTLNYLQEQKDTSFFLYLPYTLPHANNEAHHWNETGMEIPDLGEYRDMDWPLDQRAHAAMISRLDSDIGRIMEKLRELKLDSNTLVIFTSDNGPHNEGGAKSEFFNSNGEFRGVKRDLYEGGIRVPFIARWTGKIEPNKVSSHISAFWDVLPTLCEIAQIPPSQTDGISFFPSLMNMENQPVHNFLYWEFYEQGGKQAVRMDNWKCIQLEVNDPDKTEIQLFDLSNDPRELHNVANAHPEIIKRAQEYMNQAHSYSPVFHFNNEKVAKKQ